MRSNACPHLNAQLVLPFIDSIGPAFSARDRNRPALSKPCVMAEPVLFQYYFPFMIAAVQLPSYKNHRALIESKIKMKIVREKTISKNIILEKKIEPIRFVPRRLHVYLDHHFIVYFNKNFGHDKKLQIIAAKLEKNGKYLFGDIVQVDYAYLQAYMTENQIEYLRSKLRLVKDLDIGMRTPKWISPLIKQSSPLH